MMGQLYLQIQHYVALIQEWGLSSVWSNVSFPMCDFFHIGCDIRSATHHTQPVKMATSKIHFSFSGSLWPKPNYLKLGTSNLHKNRGLFSIMQFGNHFILWYTEDIIFHLLPWGPFFQNTQLRPQILNKNLRPGPELRDKFLKRTPVFPNIPKLLYIGILL